jgi:hypothetical protein
MSSGFTGFEIVFIAHASGILQILEDAPDEDRATVAFHQAQDDLHQVGAAGELVVLDKSNVHHLVLRTAIRSRSANHPRHAV